MMRNPVTGSAPRETLARTFGFTSFRPLQEDIVHTILGGNDVFALMPTGGGKSLCYQLPALLLDGVTVVVSPLIALMKDQVDALRAQGVEAAYINSSLSGDEISKRLEMMSRGQLKLVYVAPERLMMPGFLRRLQEMRPALFAVDEAHCISEWGHDFRPEYRELARLRELFPQTPLAAFTATATQRVQDDIRSQLKLDRAPVFRGGFNRPNLYYDVRPKRDAYGQILTYIRDHREASGIIYCGSRNGTEDLARRLAQDGVKAVAYHAGLTPEQRRKGQEAFARDNVQVVVATVAFGMGIDKPDVRFVIHYDLPRTLENYYQESGRAGRDGEPSDCILFYSGGDAGKLRSFAVEKETEEERQIALWQVQQMVNWADGAVCRRQALLAYFDEESEPQEARCCDICSTPGEDEDVTVEAQKFLSCVKRTRERFALTHVVNVLRGSRERRVLQWGHDKLSTYGIGADRSQEWWRDLAQHLIQSGHLRQNLEQFNALSVTDLGARVLLEGERVTMRVRRRPESQGTAPVSNPELFARLRALRKEMADERGVPPYVIFHDRSLREMAAYLPTSPGDLQRIAGVGERKAASFGTPFLQAISGYVSETGAVPGPHAPPETRRERARPSMGDTGRETLRLFRQGKGITQIAAERGLTDRTIEGHLVDAIGAGESVELARLVSPERQAAIESAFQALGDEYLTPVREHLGDGYTYAELQLIRAAMRRARMGTQPA